MAQSPQRNPAYRPNPERGVFLSEAIEQSTLDRLTPQILRLQVQSREPITLYIDSYGGSVASSFTLHRLLKSVDQDGNAACRLLTVVTGTAASAAADLLMASDYALAYQHARILCHGVRQFQNSDMLTRETAVDLAKYLANSNERFAIQLADNCILRFIFRLVALSSEFEEIRQSSGNPLLPQTECYIQALENRVSPSLIKVLKQALNASVDNDALDTFSSQQLQGIDIGSLPRAQVEALIIRAILDYEIEQHTKDSSWSFLNDGLDTIEDKLVLLFDKYNSHHREMIDMLCARWGDSLLSNDKKAEIAALAETERLQRTNEETRETFGRLWFFFVSICRLLQKDDYWMSAEEAYWLGLIDEIIGRTDLPSLRLFLEYAPENGASGAA